MLVLAADGKWVKTVHFSGLGVEKAVGSVIFDNENNTNMLFCGQKYFKWFWIDFSLKIFIHLWSIALG